MICFPVTCNETMKIGCMAMTMLLITGNFDLSVGSVAAFAGAGSAWLGGAFLWRGRPALAVDLGARVLAVDLSSEGGEETAALIRQRGGEARSVVADVSRADDVANYVAAAVGAWGRIDVFMNNAAWQGSILPVIDCPDEMFDRVMAINVRGVFSARSKNSRLFACVMSVAPSAIAMIRISRI